MLLIGAYHVPQLCLVLYTHELFDPLTSLIKFCHYLSSAEDGTEDQVGSDLPKGIYLVKEPGIVKTSWATGLPWLWAAVASTQTYAHSPIILIIPMLM